MRINGFEINRIDGMIFSEEVCGEQTKSCRAMVEFAMRFPIGNEVEWDSFVIKHTAMQKKEIETAINEFLNREQLN